MRRALPIVGAILLAGCADMLRPPRVTPLQARAGDRAPRYEKALARWSRHAEIYQGLDARMFFAATLQGTEFREARVAEIAGFRALSLEAVQTMLEEERRVHAEGLELMVGVHANERRFDDLSRARSIWSVALVSEAGEVAPLSIERIARPDANLLSLYPYLEPFWTAYRIRFPRTFANGAQVLPLGSKRVSVRFASSLGKAQLTWELEPPPASASESAWP